jgi:hypothetical protein
MKPSECSWVTEGATSFAVDSPRPRDHPAAGSRYTAACRSDASWYLLFVQAQPEGTASSHRAINPNRLKPRSSITDFKLTLAVAIGGNANDQRRSAVRPESAAHRLFRRLTRRGPEARRGRPPPRWRCGCGSAFILEPSVRVPQRWVQLGRIRSNEPSRAQRLFAASEGAQRAATRIGRLPPLAAPPRRQRDWRRNI